MTGNTARLLAVAFAIAVNAMPAQAQETATPTPQAAAPRADFTFKRVRPPAPGEQRRINIQIAPSTGAGEAAVAQVTSVVVPTRAQDATQHHDWFWDVVTPALEPPEDGKWIEAVTHALRAPSSAPLGTPDLQQMTQIAQAHGRDILRESIGTEVSPALALAVIAVESGGAADAVSSAGAVGLMQLIPATADRFGVEDATNAGQNIRGGVQYLDWLLEQFYGDPILALAGYNAGENTVRAHGGVPAYAETRGYVPKVLAAWSVARNLCMTPPELPGDGCVFAVQ